MHTLPLTVTVCVCVCCRRYAVACRPYLCHPKSVSSPDVLDAGTVRGVVGLGGRLYFVCRQSDVIQVFDDRPPYARHDDIGVCDLTWPHDIAACSETNRLFVTDSANKCFFRIDLSSACKVTKWTKSKYAPFALSVRRRRLLLTPNVFFSLQLLVLDCDSVELARIELPKNMEPRHAVETDRGTFLVCLTSGRGKEAHDQVS
jgi:hypothetical protein